MVLPPTVIHLNSVDIVGLTGRPYGSPEISNLTDFFRINLTEVNIMKLISLILVAYLAFTHAAPRIAVLNFELHDITSQQSAFILAE
jgi:hypothetical protein